MAKLTLSSWASIAEIVSAIAVVLSLIYVATELRGNTRAVEAATLVEVNKIAREHLLLVWSNQEANRISMVGDEDLSQLSPEERQRYYWNVRSFWLGMQTVFRQHDLGMSVWWRPVRRFSGHHLDHRHAS
ncbi:MAG: hypothetical protein ACYSUQ_09230 [Planctomycetota bacterium]|jgi:hypothetical protein